MSRRKKFFKFNLKYIYNFMLNNFLELKQTSSISMILVIAKGVNMAIPLSIDFNSQTLKS